MEGIRELPEEMASNKQPYIMCPSCFKGGIKFNYVTNEGSCDHCDTRFTKHGNNVRFM